MTDIAIALIAATLGAVAGFFLGVSGECIRSADMLANTIAAEHHRCRQLSTGTRGTRI